MAYTFLKVTVMVKTNLLYISKVEDGVRERVEKRLFKIVIIDPREYLDLRSITMSFLLMQIGCSQMIATKINFSTIGIEYLLYCDGSGHQGYIKEAVKF